jgi:hypothetical protein
MTRTAGLVHVILFACTRSILPPRSIFPKFRISSPQVLISSTAVPDSDFDSHFGNPTSEYGDSEKNMGPPAIIGTRNRTDPFADPAFYPIDENTIKRMDSADTVHSSSKGLPRDIPHALLPRVADYVDRPIAPVRPSRLKMELRTQQSEETLVEGPVRTPLKHREGEALEVPVSPESVLQYYGIV